MIFDEMCVLGNGDVVCSCGDPAGLRVYGNIHNDRVADIYNGPTYQSARSLQLNSPGTAYCSVIDAQCSGRVSSPTTRDGIDGRVVRTLQLEPASYCNLRCPECPVTMFKQDSNYRSDRASMLSLETMLDLIDQLPDLEKLLFFNFGEPFLHPQAIPFLREVRQRRPDVIIHTSTNGIVLQPEQVEQLAAEALVDRVVFSIDGARQESYASYRVRGHLGRALQRMSSFAEACRRHGTPVEVHWQYILFEWNDSDSEIAEAREIARHIGVPLKWVVTHTTGASPKYTAGSDALSALMAGGDTWDALTCEMRAQNRWSNGGVADGSYLADLSSERDSLRLAPGETATVSIKLKNQARLGWPENGYYRLGLQLQTQTGRPLEELQGVLVPENLYVAGTAATVMVPIQAPEKVGRYDVMIDVVQEGVCWFSERGSTPVFISLDVRQQEGQCAAETA